MYFRLNKQSGGHLDMQLEKEYGGGRLACQMRTLESIAYSESLEALK